MRERIYLNDDWKFTEEYTKELLEVNFDGAGLQTVRLPHTCRETPFHYFDESIYQMVSGYRKIFSVPSEWKGKEVLLTIEGAAHHSEVYLNGKKAGEHHCGYTAYTLELKDFLFFGEDNVLVVKVDSRETQNIPPFGFVIDYMTYGGIYRDVYLEIKETAYVKDVFVRSELREFCTAGDGSSLGSGKVIASVTVNESGEGETAAFYLRKKGSEPFCFLGERPLSGKTQTEIQFPADGVELWDTEHPVLYEMKTELKKDGRTMDENITVFGFRSAVFLQDGFYLNGRKTKIRGLNRHQSYPYVGYAMPKSMQIFDADILKRELGLNAVRTSHYPQSHYFLDRCDELGLLVFTEIPGWQYIGDAAWKDQAVENVKNMVVQYRNHASVILWGVRINESQDDDTFYRRTNEAAHALDPSRQTGGVRAHKKSSLLEDVYTYNDFSHDGKTRGCEPKKAVTSDRSKPYLVSEYNGHMYPTKSFDGEEHRAEHAIRHANVLNAIAGETDIAGSFGWCMSDYNTHKDFGSGDRICYHGVMDMFRNPKIASFIYACEQEETPVLEITSSMDIGEHPGCNRGAAWILTNADSVRMYKNGRFIKEYKKEESPYRNLSHGPILIDDFIGDAIEKGEDFKPGQAEEIKRALNATARYGLSNLPKSVYLIAIKMMLLYRMKPVQAVELYNRYIGDWGGTSTSYRFEAVKDGKIVKTIVKEPMKSVHLKAEADHTLLREEHSYDVAAIRIQALDQNGSLLSFYQEPVQLEVTGPIELIGAKIISLQGGMGGTYVKTKGVSGRAELKITSADAEIQRIVFQVQVETILCQSCGGRKVLKETVI